MIRRKRPGSLRFVPLSLGLHLVLVLLLWLFWVEPPGETPIDPGIQAKFFKWRIHDALIVRTPPSPPAPPQAPVVPPAEERPKPQWTAEAFAISFASPAPERRNPHARRDAARNAGLRSREPLKDTPDPAALPTRLQVPAPIARAALLPATRAEVPAPPEGHVASGSLADDAELSEAAVGLHTEGRQAGVRRGGGGFSWVAYGNANPQPGRSDGTFRGLMVNLARQIEAQVEQRAIDVVFVVDATGSMKDNILGIRAYLSDFAKRLQRDGKDAAYGVVLFTDLIVERPRARGVSKDSSEVRNWLYHTDYSGGGDLAESGLEALMAAIREIDYRRGAQRVIVLVTDGPLHDADYDGQSQYTLDQVIGELRKRRFIVNVVGIDGLPLRQIARATGGEWYPIPGRGYLEEVPNPIPEKLLSGLALLSRRGPGRFEVVVSDPGVRWVDFSWKVLDPIGGIWQRAEPRRWEMAQPSLVIPVELAVNTWPKDPFPYTLICRVTDDRGRSSVLRSPLWP